MTDTNGVPFHSSTNVHLWDGTGLEAHDNAVTGVPHVTIRDGSQHDVTIFCQTREAVLALYAVVGHMVSMTDPVEMVDTANDDAKPCALCGAVDRPVQYVSKPGRAAHLCDLCAADPESLDAIR